MKTKTLKIGIIAGLLFCFSGIAAPTWDAYFPTGKAIKARVMALAISPEINRITVKMREALSQNQEWLKSHMGKTPEGKPLPYDKRFGISEAEYKRLLSQKMALREVGKVELLFKSIDKKHIKIVASGTPIDGLVVAPDSVVTPFGTLVDKKPINNTDDKSPTGAWEGIQWKHSAANAAAIKDIQFNVGKLKKSREGIIYYDVKDIDPSTNRNIQITYILFYPLK